MINWADFEKIDIRVGTILEAEDFPEARNPSYKLTIDFGELGVKRSSAQITRLYTREMLKGMQITAVVNFPPKRIAGFSSECLVLGAIGEHGEVTLLTPSLPAVNGLRIG
jgi:tRNA-binding protein